MNSSASSFSLPRAAGPDLQESSPYLESILAPFTGLAAIPDANLTSSFPKATTFSDNFRNPENLGEILYVYLPHRRNKPLRVYIKVPALGPFPGGFVYYKTINLDQDLAEDFTMGRFVSGGLTIQSATISAGAFDIAGTITAAAVQELPVLTNLNISQIPSSKRNSTDVVVQLPASQGVTCLASPDSDNRYTVFDTRESFDSTGVILVFDEKEEEFLPSGLLTGWTYGSANVAANGFVIVYNSMVAPGLIPPNAWGHTKIRASMNISFQWAVPVANIPAVTIQFQAHSNVTTNGVSHTVFTEQRVKLISAHGIAAVQRIDWEDTIDWNTDHPIDWVDITFNVPNVATNIITVERAYIEYTYMEYYSEGFNRTGFLIGLEGIESGQTITVSGVENDEVVPNSVLSKNITTSYFGPFNPIELEMVSHYLANAQRNGVRFLWTAEDYRIWVMGGGHKRHSNIENVATATGFAPFLKGILGFGKKLITTGLPMIGGYAGGPIGSTIGSLAASLLEDDDDEARAASYRRPPGPTYI